MNTTPAHKICPVCGQPAVLSMSACGRCGHVYRTVFSPAGQPMQTMVIPSSDAINQLVGEYKSFFHQCMWVAFGLGVPTGGLGLLLLAFLWQHEQNILRRVTEIGMDSKQFKESLKMWMAITFCKYATAFTFIALFVFWLVTR
jgi:hypothetical protein